MQIAGTDATRIRLRPRFCRQKVYGTEAILNHPSKTMMFDWINGPPKTNIGAKFQLLRNGLDRV
jgi:hypothetical protein